MENGENGGAMGETQQKVLIVVSLIVCCIGFMMIGIAGMFMMDTS